MKGKYITTQIRIVCAGNKILPSAKTTTGYNQGHTLPSANEKIQVAMYDTLLLNGFKKAS